METGEFILRPLTENELGLLTNQLLDFFNPMRNKEIRDFLSLPVNVKTMQPLSLFDFLNYLDKKSIIPNPFGYMHHIISLSHKLASEGILIPAGNSGTAPGLSLCYYCFNIRTSLQEKSDFWLASIIGERYLRMLVCDFIVRIEGEDISGELHTGSGVLIASDTILTCAHNINDMKITSCWIGDTRLTIHKEIAHDRYDVGIIKVSPVYEDRDYPYLGSPQILDKTLTLGYPPLRGLREPSLLAQSGEINAIGSEMITGCECITISSITRPGNSGGPVFSLQGFIVGIVISSTHLVESFSAQDDENNNVKENHSESPFYLAVSSNELIKIVKEMDPALTVNFEDFH
ncbi:MAG: trypsin-like peptidase domain-containing protein [Clostridia bacterium]|nr:trypsin-like peptidase domain-containing protein [Clostridia bacterium]